MSYKNPGLYSTNDIDVLGERHCSASRWSTTTIPSISYHDFFRIPPNRLLYSVLPPSVANELRHKRPVPAKRYDNVTILFSGIVGFNAFCSKHASGEGAMKIVNLLNDLYTRFDTLTDSRKNPFVYKASPDHQVMQCRSDTSLQRHCGQRSPDGASVYRKASMYSIFIIILKIHFLF